MTCQTCAHWSPRKNLEMAKLKLALCALGTRWTFFPPHAQPDCEKHQPASAEAQQARAVWLAREEKRDAGR